MANRHRGEIEVDIGGARRRLGVAGEAGPEAILPLARGRNEPCERGGECHRAHCHAGRGQLPPLGGLHHRTDRARCRSGTAQLLKKIAMELFRSHRCVITVSWRDVTPLQQNAEKLIAPA